MESNDVFDMMACRYDTADRVSNAKVIVHALRDELTDTKQKTALDYGCGTGLVGLGLIDLFQSMLLVDASPQMVEQVKLKLESARIGNAGALCCDFLQEPPQVQADYVIMTQVLLHIPDTRTILTRLFDAVKEDGHLIIVDFDKNESIPSDKVHNGFEQKELIQLIKQVGFVSAEAHTFYHGQKIFMKQDASMFILNAKK